MIKQAYQKFYYNPLWLIYMWGIIAIVVSEYLARLTDYTDSSSEAARALMYLMILGCMVAVTIVLSIYFKQIKSFEKNIHSLPPSVQDELEQDFARQNRIGNLYFTRHHLISFSLSSFGSVGLACIHYSEITGLQIKEVSRTETPTKMEVLGEDRFSTRVVDCGIELTDWEIGTIKETMEAAKSMDFIACSNSQSKPEKLQYSIMAHAFLAFSNFISLFFFMIFSGEAAAVRPLKEQLEKGDNPVLRHELGCLMFWPNFWFYLLVGGGLILLFAYAALGLLRLRSSQADRILANRFTFRILRKFAVLHFILLLGFSIITSMQNSWDIMLEGFQLLW